MSCSRVYARAYSAVLSDDAGEQELMLLYYNKVGLLMEMELFVALCHHSPPKYASLAWRMPG
jgi:hypothetical protein